METILVTQTSPVGAELFSCLKASSCYKIFAQLLVRSEQKCSISTKSRYYSEHNKDNMLIYVPQQDTGQHYGGRLARPSAAQRSRPLSQRLTNLDIYVLSRKPPCGRVGETKNSKRNLKLPRINMSYGQRSFIFSAASLWNRLPEELKDCSTLTFFENKLKRIEICKLLWTIFSKCLVSLSSNSRLRIIIFWLIFAFFIYCFFFWESCVDYQEILGATLNYYYYYYYYY